MWRAKALFLVLALSLVAGGARAFVPIGGFRTVEEIDLDQAKLRAALTQYIEDMRIENAACEWRHYQEAWYSVRDIITLEPDHLRNAPLHGDKAALKTEIENQIIALELMKSEIPPWTCEKQGPVGDTRPAQFVPGGEPPVSHVRKPPATTPPPPPPPGPPIAPVAQGPKPLPDGLRRPQLYDPDIPGLPAGFCTAEERNAFINGLYKNVSDAANDDAKASTAYLQTVSSGAERYMRASDGLNGGALLREYDAYKPIMERTLERAKALNALYSRILDIPIGRNCPRTAEAVSPPPVVAAPIPSGFLSPNAAGRALASDRIATAGKPDCPPKVGRKAILVGPNGKVGSGARTKSKVASTVMGLAGGLLGGGGSPLGGGGGGGGPPMVNCRIKDSEMTVFRDPATGTALKVGAKRVKDTVTVFSKIDASPDSGTFQTAFMQKPDGAVLAPASVGICDLWGEWKLTVSWTRDTYQDNELVKHEAGGWSEGGKFALPGMASTTERPDGLWRRLGFSNASHGARMVALTYKVPPGELAATPMDLVVHVTRPSQDPVTTTPFAMTLAEGPSGFRLAGAGDDACPLPPTRTLIDDGANAAGGGRLIDAANPPAETPRTPAPDKAAGHADVTRVTDREGDRKLLRESDRDQARAGVQPARPAAPPPH